MGGSPTSFAKHISRFLKAPFRHASPDKDSNENYERPGHTDPSQFKAGIIKDLQSQAKRIPADLHLLIQLVQTKLAGGYEDDSKYLV